MSHAPLCHGHARWSSARQQGLWWNGPRTTANQWRLDGPVRGRVDLLIVPSASKCQGCWRIFAQLPRSLPRSLYLKKVDNHTEMSVGPGWFKLLSCSGVDLASSRTDGRCSRPLPPQCIALEDIRAWCGVVLPAELACCSCAVAFTCFHNTLQ